MYYVIDISKRWQLIVWEFVSGLVLTLTGLWIAFQFFVFVVTNDDKYQMCGQDHLDLYSFVCVVFYAVCWLITVVVACRYNSKVSGIE